MELIGTFEGKETKLNKVCIMKILPEESAHKTLSELMRGARTSTGMPAFDVIRQVHDVLIEFGSIDNVFLADTNLPAESMKTTLRAGFSAGEDYIRAYVVAPESGESGIELQKQDANILVWLFSGKGLQYINGKLKLQKDSFGYYYCVHDAIMVRSEK